VVFSEAVQNFDAEADLVISHTGTSHAGVTFAGSGDTYTVTVTGIAGDGSFTLAVNTGSDVQDPATNALASSVTSAAVVIVNTGPSAVTITPSTLGPTAANSIDFTVVFSVPVINFNDETDLVISHAGTSHTVATIAGGGANYTVTVNGIAGDGAFTLAVSTASDVQDLASNPLVSSVTSAAVVIDNTAPTADTITPTTLGPTNVSSISFTVNFSESVQGFNAESDLVISHSGTSHTGATVAGSGANYTVTVNGIAGDGSFTLAVSTGSDVQDPATNALASSVTSAAVAIDNTAPTADSITASTAGPVEFVDTVNFTVVFSENVVQFDSISDIVIYHSGTFGGNAIITGGPSTYNVAVSNVGGNGTYTLSVNTVSGVEDPAGNPLASSVTSAPPVAVQSPSDFSTSTISSSPPSNGVNTVDPNDPVVYTFTLNNTGTGAGAASLSVDIPDELEGAEFITTAGGTPATPIGSDPMVLNSVPVIVGGSAVVELQATVRTDVPDGQQFTGQATLTPGTGSPINLQTGSYLTTHVVTNLQASTMVGENTTPPINELNPDDVVLFTITVANAHLTSQSGVEVQVTQPNDSDILQVVSVDDADHLVSYSTPDATGVDFWSIDVPPVGSGVATIVLSTTVQPSVTAAGITASAEVIVPAPGIGASLSATVETTPVQVTPVRDPWLYR
jgi:hypothetical protein